MVDAGASLRLEGLRVGRLLSGAAALTAAAAWIARYGVGLEAVVVGALFATLAVISTIDIETRRIPNRIVLPAAAVSLGAVALLQPDHLGAAVGAAAGAFLFFFVPSLVSPRWVGVGDAKLALLIGAMLGGDTLNGLLFGSLGAGAFAVVSVALGGRRALTATIPFGPFLSAGAALALVTGGGTLYS